MNEELLDLHWPVARAGYHWLPGYPKQDSPRTQRLRKASGDEPSWYLLARPQEAGEEGFREYTPFAVTPPLFRRLAGIEPSAEQILAFANRFGMLGCATRFCAAESGPRARACHSLLGESRGRWTSTIEQLRRLVHLWDLCLAGDIDGLSKNVYWEDATILYSHQPLSERTDARHRCAGRQEIMLRRCILERVPTSSTPHADTTWFERMIPGELVLPTLVFLQRQINEHLEPQSAPRLLWNLPAGSLELCWRPATLLGMLWLQFARELSGKLSYRECPVCQTWVRIGHDAARGNRRFCSNACRTQGLRARQGRARELFGEGRSIESIARELGCHMDAVRRWL
jgi:hypothetical protein